MDFTDLRYSQLCWYFRSSFVICCPSNLLSGSTVPPPPPFPLWISILYTCIQRARGGGMGFSASDRLTPAAKSLYRSTFLDDDILHCLLWFDSFYELFGTVYADIWLHKCMKLIGRQFELSWWSGFCVRPDNDICKVIKRMHLRLNSMCCMYAGWTCMLKFLLTIFESLVFTVWKTIKNWSAYRSCTTHTS
jgi:hypothetical protein